MGIWIQPWYWWSGYLCGHEARVDRAARIVRRDRRVDIVGDDEQEGARCRLQCVLTRGASSSRKAGRLVEFSISSATMTRRRGGRSGWLRISARRRRASAAVIGPWHADLLGGRQAGVEDFPGLAQLPGLRQELNRLHVVQPAVAPYRLRACGPTESPARSVIKRLMALNATFQCLQRCRCGRGRQTGTAYPRPGQTLNPGSVRRCSRRLD